MARKGNVGDSIEGRKVSVQTRQFHPFPPKKNAETGERRYGFKLGIRSTAEIAEENDAADIPVSSKSMKSLGDSVFGESISGWARKPLGDPNVSKGSASHSAGFLLISGGCFAQVVVGPREIMENSAYQESLQKKSKDSAP
jgi:hypothetical protein